MSTLTPTPYRRVLTIEPYWRGFGYAVLEGPGRIVDWAIKESREEKQYRILKQISALLKLYEPDVVVIEDLADNRRKANTRDLMAGIVDLVRSENYTVATISRSDLKRAFASGGKATKEAIAQKVVERFPELADWLPPMRKIWDSEDSKLHIFTAVANAVAYFQRAESSDW